jgi:hypothetical protein
MLLRKLLIIVCLFIAGKATAQTDIVVNGDTMTLPNGATFSVGQQITLGSGSNPDKSFAFVYQPELLHITKKKFLDASNFGKVATIKKFQRDGEYKGGYSYNILVLDIGGLRNYWCDIKYALRNGEVAGDRHSEKNTPVKSKKGGNGPVVF